MTSDWDDTAAAPVARSARHRPAPGPRRLAGGVACASRTRRHRARRAVVLATAPAPPSRRSRGWPKRGRGTTATSPRPRRSRARLLVLGGGAIGVEMAQAFRRLGAGGDVLEGDARLLAREEPFAGDEVAAAFEAEGITVVTGRAVTGSIARSRRPGVGDARGRPHVRGRRDPGRGRTPAEDEDLGLETVGLEPGRLRRGRRPLRATGVDGDWLYAVGDCNGLALLTHMGKYQARHRGRRHPRQGRPTCRPRHRAARSRSPTRRCARSVSPTAQARAAGNDVRVVTY